MSDSTDEKLALTPKEFAALFGKSQTWAYRQLYAGKVQALTGYGRILIPASEAKRVLAEAGIYNGAAKSVDKPKQEAVESSPGRKNSWRDGVRSRRERPGQKRDAKTRGKNAEQEAARETAMRKLNRSGK